MPTPVEKIAINYRDGEGEKICKNCAYVEIRMALGHFCRYYYLPTKPGKWCSLGSIPLKKAIPIEPIQGFLF